MTMGIVNAGMIGVIDDLSEELKTIVEDVVLNRKPDATDRMIDIAGSLQGKKKEKETDECGAMNITQYPLKRKLSMP